MKFNENMARIRKSLIMTQSDLAKITGLPVAEISHYETGSRKPGIVNIVLICKGLSCTPNDLIDL